ncbi:hypothetical protein HK405_006468 [Cladochytrium tenue]|nr:hypothetical protein HK405_006468 [Cladochytrium tenue]
MADVCSSRACEIALTFVVPSIGCLVSLFLFISPLPAIRAAVKANDGSAVNMYSSLQIFPLKSVSTRHAASTTFIALTGLLFVAAAVSQLALAHDTGKILLGVATNVVLVAFYASPLLALAEVVRRKDASGINPLIAMASFTNGGLWSIYGFAIRDWFIAVPNLPGPLLALVQFALVAAYSKAGRRRRHQHAEEGLGAAEAATSEVVSGGSAFLSVTAVAPDSAAAADSPGLAPPTSAEPLV